MKSRLFLAIAVAISVFSCKNEKKEENDKAEPSRTKKEIVLTDSLKTDSSAVNLTGNNRAADKKLLQDFFIKNDKKAQFLVINNTKDTTIVCAEKTRITIPANSFVSSKNWERSLGKNYDSC